jgi:carbamoyl-phosphate synthase large subunit
MDDRSVMIAGVGGASLGTELAKALRLTGAWRVYGCDISRLAFGLHSEDFEQSFHVSKSNYVESVIDACQSVGCRWLVPGGEQPLNLLSRAYPDLQSSGIELVANAPDVVSLCMDKKRLADALLALGISQPATCVADEPDAAAVVGLPCVVKPSSGSGGSTLVFLAESEAELSAYSRLIRASGRLPVAQEYISEAEGEFTVGVLSLSDQSVVGSIALRRNLDAKLSVAYRSRAGIISSGYSQGLIDDFADIRRTAEDIALRIGSRGPINVQGRVKDGKFMPFEINPRFSASTYLRALAGFNEIDLFLEYLRSGKRPQLRPIQYGFYLRSFSETFVPKAKIV